VLALLGGIVLNQPDLGMLLVYGALTIAMAVPRRRECMASGFDRRCESSTRGPCHLVRTVPIRADSLFPRPSGVQHIIRIPDDPIPHRRGVGGVLGRGLGASRAKLFYLPQAHNDFILSVVAEEAGLLGTLAVLGLIGLLVWRAFVVSEQASDRLGQLLALGIGFVIGFQALLNAGVVLGLLPVTGLTLPFFSNGGSSLLVTLAMVGVLLNVSRRGTVTG